jgi:hypothetical protein
MGTDLRTAAQQALEALGKWSSGRDMDAVQLNDLIATLEAALEQEPVAWRSLSEEEILPLYSMLPSSHAEMLEFARAVEAALRSKNHD